MFDCMCWCVCVCEADPSSRQQLNLSVVRKGGSVVCCQTNGESEYTKRGQKRGRFQLAFGLNKQRYPSEIFLTFKFNKKLFNNTSHADVCLKLTTQISLVSPTPPAPYYRVYLQLKIIINC